MDSIHSEAEPVKINGGSDLKTPAVEAVLDSIRNAVAVPTAEEVEMQALYDAFLLSTEKEYPEVQYLLSVDGVPAISLADVTLVQDAAKAGKTKLISILLATMLGGEWGVLKRLVDKVKIVMFDTEQYIADTSSMYNSILSMAGREPKDVYDELKVFNIRIQSFEQRKDFVFRVIRKECPQMAVIDGVRDLNLDINDPKTCPAFVQELMQLASEVGCAIIVVLHNNPGDEKARGWLGTEILNKCGSSFECCKSGNVVTVKNVLYRRAKAPAWSFTFTPDGTPTPDETLISQAVKNNKAEEARLKEIQRIATDDEILKRVIPIINGSSGRILRSDLVSAMEERKIYKSAAAQNFINRSLARGVLISHPVDKASKSSYITLPEQPGEETDLFQGEMGGFE